MKPKNIVEETEAVSPETLPLGGASCSPSSDTPETDALLVPRPDTRANAIMAVQEVRKHACKLERQRNALMVTLERIIEDMDGSGDEIGAKQERAHLREILSENAEVREKGMICGECNVLAMGAKSMTCTREDCPGKSLENV